jgi:hypothetical protein
LPPTIGLACRTPFAQDESRDIWQTRVNRDWRFYFTIMGDTYCIEDIISHPK